MREEFQSQRTPPQNHPAIIPPAFIEAEARIKAEGDSEISCTLFK